MYMYDFQTMPNSVQQLNSILIHNIPDNNIYTQQHCTNRDIRVTASYMYLW